MKDILESYVAKGLLYSQSHPSLPLTIYNYTDKVQWEGLWDDITLMSRGLVVDDLGNIVARPFKKFFNLSEGKTNTTSEYDIFEKYDGSLGILFFYKGDWILASRGSFTSEQAIKGKKILNKSCDYNLLNIDNTYCFEIIYKDNRIVVDYGDTEECILTAVFNTSSGEEQDLYSWQLPVAVMYNIETPLNKLHEVIRNIDEGYVIKFSNGERCKIKGAEYLRLHKTMSEMSTTAVWDCLRNGDSILSVLDGYPDEWYQTVKDYEEHLSNEFNQEKIKIYNEFKTINVSLGNCDNKTFALFVKSNAYKSYLFALRNNKDIDKLIWNNLKPKFRRL